MKENKVDLEKLLHYCFDVLNNEKHLTQAQVYEKVEEHIASYDPENRVITPGSLEALMLEGLRPLAL